MGAACRHPGGDLTGDVYGDRPVLRCIACGAEYLGKKESILESSPPPPVSTPGSGLLGDGELDHHAAEEAVRTLLRYLGENPDRAGLVATPGRVCRALRELTEGLRQNPLEHLETDFPLDDLPLQGQYDQIILSRNLSFTSLCEHHLLPFTGVAHIAYLPEAGGRIVGLSKLARVLDAYARRPQVQERLTQQVADTLQMVLAPRGVAVVIRARHSCQCLRGVRKDGEMVTSAMYGAFRDELSTKEELMRLITL